jgi:hypothetical protein
MAHARQHVPDIPELKDKDITPQSSTYGNCQELLKLPWVAQWKNQKNFHRWCRSDRGDMLMVENKDGTWWWVVAYVTTGTIDGLPVVRCKELGE